MLLLILLTAFCLMTVSTFAQSAPPIEPGVSQALARWRAAHYRDVRYRLDLTLEKGAPLMTGEITIGVVLSDEGARSDLVLDWRTTSFEADVNKPSARVLAVNDKSDVPPSFAKDHIVIDKSLLKPGENQIKIAFASPIKTSGAAVTRYTDKEDGAEYVYSLFVPSDASTAFPVFDQPDLKARFTLEVKSKTFERVVSNAIGKTSDFNTNTDRFTFAETAPISTYVFAFAAGDFVSVQENPPLSAQGQSIKAPEMEGTRDNFRVFVRRSQIEKFKPHEREVFRLNREAVKYLESYFDYKFPFSKYDLVLIPEFPFGGMEHAGATFLRESSIIFPSEPTANDYISRANLIFHEAAHQWFGDTVTMRWFDDLWLKEGFAEFMAYKTLEKVLPEYNAWKAFYERNKPLAYLTDSTRGTTPIYQEIPNLSAAKSAYGNIVYRKAPSFLRQAEFYLGEKEFQTAVRAFLKKHEFKNAEWTDLVNEFETASKQDLTDWAEGWVKKRGLPIVKVISEELSVYLENSQGGHKANINIALTQNNALNEDGIWRQKLKVLTLNQNGEKSIKDVQLTNKRSNVLEINFDQVKDKEPKFIFPNYQDYGYGIFLLDDKSREYVLKNIRGETDAFLRSMMWGALWDSVREAELAPRDYVDLAIRNIDVETDDLTIQTILARVGTAMNYYLSEKQRDELAPRLEATLVERVGNAKTMGQRITFYRAYLNLASSAQAQRNFRDILAGRSKIAVFQLRTKDKFDVATRLLILGDAQALRLLAELEKTETSDDAKRYAYAARAGVATTESKAQFFRDFLKNKDLSESWIEAAFVPFNSVRHADLTAPYLETALAELPNLKRNRKIFFVNAWLAAFLGGQTSEESLAVVNRFLENNQNLDRDLRLKILENVDNLERAVRIRAKYAR